MTEKIIKAVLTIAGSDCSGGAGIQADLKTIEAHRLYGMSVITAVTAQNTTGVSGIHAIPADFVAKQIDSIFSDIRPDAVKIGMLQDREIILATAERLRFYRAGPIVLDPVMLSSSGSPLLEESAVTALVSELMPLCTLLTPNLAEAAVLAGQAVGNRTQMEQAARCIAGQTGCAVLVKGGHLAGCADDLLWDSQQEPPIQWYPAARLDNPNTHGTGCTLSSAIACGLAQGYRLSDSIQRAKQYLTACIRAGLNLGQGTGPLCHWAE